MNLTEQGIVDLINANTISISNKELELKILEKSLLETDIYKKITEIKEDLYKIKQHDLSIRTQGKQLLIDNNIKKFESLDGTIIQLNKKAGVLKIKDETIPELREYQKEKIVTSIDKKTLKEDIKQGLVIDGVTIESDYTLAIKHK